MIILHLAGDFQGKWNPSHNVRKFLIEVFEEKRKIQGRNKIIKTYFSYDVERTYDDFNLISFNYTLFIHILPVTNDPKLRIIGEFSEKFDLFDKKLNKPFQSPHSSFDFAKMK